MKQQRRLALSRETLTDLSTDEMAAVQGGAIETVLKYCAAIEPSSPVRCLTRGTTCINCE
jgi:hypothetical protein